MVAQDATDEFNAIHSQKAKKMLADYLIGRVGEAPAKEAKLPLIKEHEVRHKLRHHVCTSPSSVIQQSGAQRMMPQLRQGAAEELGTSLTFFESEALHGSGTIAMHILDGVCSQT